MSASHAIQIGHGAVRAVSPGSTAVVDRLIDRAATGEKSAIHALLDVRGDGQEKLFAAARSARDAVFAGGAVVRGVIEITSACVKSCLYCPMRIENREKRYFRRAEDILASVAAIRAAGIGVVFFQGGEIAATTRLMLDVIPSVRDLYAGEVEVLLCLGDKPRDELRALREAGADSYIIKHETADPDLHLKMRRLELAQRLTVIRDAIDLGYRTGVGTIVGLPGQTHASLVDDVLLAKALGARMTSASPFIPAPATPLEDEPPGDVDLTLNVIALMRLLQPRALIPTVSALEKRTAGGQLRGFLAGANVITVNFTPRDDQQRYPIYGKDRFVVDRKHTTSILSAAGLRPLWGADAFAFWQ
jgi:biotin synthase